MQARAFGVDRFPDLALPPEGTGRAPTSKWLSWYLKGFPNSRVGVEIKPHLGVVDLRFQGVPIGDLRRTFGLHLPLGAETEQASSGKSAAIRMRHEPLRTDLPFTGQERMFEALLGSADTLQRLAEDHRSEVMRLLGYASATI